MAARRREYPPETVFEAQELYCVARLTFEQTAEETGVAVSTLKRWSDKFDWRAKRAKLAQAEADLRADTILARSAMLKALIKSKDAQTGFAVASLETLAIKQAEAARAQKLMSVSAQKELREIHTQEDAVNALQEAVQLKLNQLLQSPEDLDFRAMQDVKKAMDMLTEMKPKENQKQRVSKGTSAELTRKIEELLGYKI